VGVCLLERSEESGRLEEVRSLEVPGVEDPIRILWSVDGRWLCCVGANGRRVTLSVLGEDGPDEEPIWQIPRQADEEPEEPVEEVAKEVADARVLPFPAHRVGGRAAVLVRVVDRYTGEVQSGRFVQEAVTIGRNPDSEIVLPGLTVSREHARIVCRKGRLVLVDLASTNGTWVNGQRIRRPELLGDEDVVTIGDYALSAEVASPDGD